MSYRRGVLSFLSYVKVRHKSHIVRYVIFTKCNEVYTFFVRYNKVRRRYVLELLKNTVLSKRVL